jgi:hypothetical protein
MPSLYENELAVTGIAAALWVIVFRSMTPFSVEGTNIVTEEKNFNLIQLFYVGCSWTEKVTNPFNG